MMFYCLDFWINEFEAKQDQIPVSGEAEFSGGKGSVSYWGSRIMEREFMGGSQSPAP